MRAPRGGGKQRRQVAAADVFHQGGEHIALHLGGKLKREFHDVGMVGVWVQFILAVGRGPVRRRFTALSIRAS